MKKIAIGGMIGIGKSTLTKNLQKYENINCLDEFAENDEIFSILLDALYRKVPNAEIFLQFYFLIDHHRKVESFVSKHKNNFDFLIFDRYLFEHYYFASLNLKQDEFIKYYFPHFTTTLASGFTSIPDLYILLDAKWETIKDRILNRGRKEEINNFEINEDYFKKLHENYIDGVIQVLDLYKIEHRVIDANCDHEELARKFLAGV